MAHFSSFELDTIVIRLVNFFLTSLLCRFKRLKVFTNSYNVFLLNFYTANILKHTKYTLGQEYTKNIIFFLPWRNFFLYSTKSFKLFAHIKCGSKLWAHSSYGWWISNDCFIAQAYDITCPLSIQFLFGDLDRVNIT